MMQTPQLSLSVDTVTGKSQSLPGSRSERAQERPPQQQQQQAQHTSLPGDATSRGQLLTPAAPPGVPIDEQRRRALEAILKVCLQAHASACVHSLRICAPWWLKPLQAPTVTAWKSAAWDRMPPQRQLQW